MRSKPVKPFVSEKQECSVCDEEAVSLWSSSARGRRAGLAQRQSCSFLWRTAHVFEFSCRVKFRMKLDHIECN